MIKLVDRDGHKVKMTKEAIAESIKKMGNPAGHYCLVNDKCSYNYVCINGSQPIVSQKTDNFNMKLLGEPVLRFRTSTMPNYHFWQIWQKKYRHWRIQKAIEKKFRANNPKNLIWKPTPFVLTMPWLRLRGKKAIMINVD